MVGAYLLDPARRTYDLTDIAAQRGLSAAGELSDGESDDHAQLELGEDEAVADPVAAARLVWELAALQRATMKEAGLPVDFVAKEPGLDPLVDALVAKLSRKIRG